MRPVQIETDDLAQIAFTAYVDAALWTMNAHQRLEAGSEAAAKKVTSAVRGRIHTKRVIAERRRAVHGTNSGYQTGCRCDFCCDAKQIYDRAYRFHNGNNAINS